MRARFSVAARSWWAFESDVFEARRENSFS